jgi:ribosomal protein S18 acetylase RimI-like enzyme
VKADSVLVRTLEELAANAWPAHVQQQLGPWRLRASEDVTRRANSVFCVGSMPVYAGWYDEVVSFYERRQLPIRFQITDAASEGLDFILQGMGYTAEAHSAVYVASCRDVLACSPQSEGFRLTLSSSLTGAWLDSFIRVEGHDASKKEGYRRIMGAIGPPTCFVQAWVDDAVVGIGMGVAEREWVGMFNIATLAGHRRKGIGTAIVRALTEWGIGNGAADAYLQVMLTNNVAINLYTKLGFRYLYGYHYRVAQSDPRGKNAKGRKK